MKYRIIITITLIVFFSIVVFLLTYHEKINCTYIYCLIPMWLLIIFFSFKVWHISTGKIFLILHLIILLSGLFSFLSYQIFKKLSDVTPISSPNFTDVSNLMFNSENALYFMIYGGFCLLIIDTVYYLKFLKK